MTPKPSLSKVGRKVAEYLASRFTMRKCLPIHPTGRAEPFTIRIVEHHGREGGAPCVIEIEDVDIRVNRDAHFVEVHVGPERSEQRVLAVCFVLLLNLHDNRGHTIEEQPNRPRPCCEASTAVTSSTNQDALVGAGAAIGIIRDLVYGISCNNRCVDALVVFGWE
jgi:hypothetical protein